MFTMFVWLQRTALEHCFQFVYMPFRCKISSIHVRLWSCLFDLTRLAWQIEIKFISEVSTRLKKRNVQIDLDGWVVLQYRNGQAASAAAATTKSATDRKKYSQRAHGFFARAHTHNNSRLTFNFSSLRRSHFFSFFPFDFIFYYYFSKFIYFYCQHRY